MELADGVESLRVYQNGALGGLREAHHPAVNERQHGDVGVVGQQSATSEADDVAHAVKRRGGSRARRDTVERTPGGEAGRAPWQLCTRPTRLDDVRWWRVLAGKRCVPVWRTRRICGGRSGRRRPTDLARSLGTCRSVESVS